MSWYWAVLPSLIFRPARRHRTSKILWQEIILSNGEVAFQPLKIERSGLVTVVDKHVLVSIHNELESDDDEGLYPADHY